MNEEVINVCVCVCVCNRIASKETAVLHDSQFLAYDLLMIIYIFTNPSAEAEYDTRSIFTRSLTGLNSEFSFS